MTNDQKQPCAVDVELQTNLIDHPDDPLQWSNLKKWTAAITLSFIDFLTPLASLMYAAAIPQVAIDLNSLDGALNAFSMTIYVLGFAVGPLVLSPVSDIYGRIWIYRGCTVFFVVFTIACGFAQDINMLIGFRLLAGIFGGAPIVIGGAMIKEMFTEEKRGNAMSIYTLGMVSGLLLGPVFGGYITQYLGWRWVFWVVCIPSGLSLLPAFFLLEETHLATIIRRKERRASPGNFVRVPRLKEVKIVSHDIAGSWTQPCRIFFASFSIVVFFLWSGNTYATYNLIGSTLSTLYEKEYDFSTGEAGLTHISLGLGNVLAVLFLSMMSDYTYEVLKRRNNGRSKPRQRLFYILLGGPLMSVGMLCYGWSLQHRVHWMVPLMGLFVTGAGFAGTMIPTNLYLLELFPDHPASALTVVAVARAVVGSLIPLAGEILYESCGYGWGNSIVAFVHLLLCVVILRLYFSSRETTHHKSRETEEVGTDTEQLDQGNSKETK